MQKERIFLFVSVKNGVNINDRNVNYVVRESKYLTVGGYHDGTNLHAEKSAKCDHESTSRLQHASDAFFFA